MARKFNSQQFQLDNLLKAFDETGLMVMWRGEDGTEDEYSIRDIMLTQPSMDEKIVVFNAIVDSWFTSQLIAYASGNSLTGSSKVDIKKAESTFKFLKINVQKLLMSTEGMKGYEFYLEKIMDMSEKVLGFKSIVNE